MILVTRMTLFIPDGVGRSFCVLRATARSFDGISWRPTSTGCNASSLDTSGNFDAVSDGSTPVVTAEYVDSGAVLGSSSCSSVTTVTT